MSFVVLLLAILVEKFSAFRQRLQCDGGWLRELHKLESSPALGNKPWWVLTILIVFPVAVLGLLLWVLEPVAYGLLVLPVHLVVVIYSLGRGDLLAGLGPIRDAWRRGDLQAGAHVAERDIGVSADSGEQLLEKVQSHLLWQAYQSFFAVIFWYFLLGPVAALSYRLLALALNERYSGPTIALVSFVRAGLPMSCQLPWPSLSRVRRRFGPSTRTSLICTSLRSSGSTRTDRPSICRSTKATSLKASRCRSTQGNW